MDSAKRVDCVLEAARGLDLLHADGTLMSLDSLNVLDMVVELERLTGLEIPTSEISREHFESVESLCTWLERLAA